MGQRLILDHHHVDGIVGFKRSEGLVHQTKKNVNTLIQELASVPTLTLTISNSTRVEFSG
jgi:hypothetical protein